MTRSMSPGVMPCSSSASATERLTTRWSASTCWGPPTPVSTRTAPPGWVTRNPCTGHSSSIVARCSRLTCRDIRPPRSLGLLIHDGFGALLSGDRVHVAEFEVAVLDDAGCVVIREVDGESDRRVERLRALQVGHRQVDKHRGHRGIPLVDPVRGRCRYLLKN